MTDSDGETGKRLRLVAEALYDGNKSDLARALSMKPGSFSKYLRGARRPGSAVLKRIARLNVNLNWFLTGRGPMFVDGAPPSGSSAAPTAHASTSTITVGETVFQRIPPVQVRVDEEEEIQFDEIGCPEWLSHAFIRRRYDVAPDRLRTFRVAWNQMAPTIRPGDRVRAALLAPPVSPGELSEGAPHLLYGSVGILLMRLARYEETVRLWCDNDDVEDYSVDAEEWGDVYRPIGRVLEVMRPT